MSGPKKKRSKKPKPSKTTKGGKASKAKIKITFQQKVRNIFERLGLECIASDLEIVDESKKHEGDFDLVFKLSSTSLVFVETTETTNDLGGHFTKKCQFYSRFASSKEDWLKKLCTASQVIKDFCGHKRLDTIDAYYIYATLHNLSETHVSRNQTPLQVLQPGDLKYFDHLAGCIGKSGSFEVAEYIDADDPFERADTIYKPSAMELNSQSRNPNSGYKIASFYANPGKLIPSACVIRQGSWRDEDHAFQRLMDLDRISDMRSYLSAGGEVFPTNLVVALRGGALKVDDNGKCFVEIPSDRQSISVVDGQHRLFAYSDIDDQFNPKISALKNEHELLVTAYIFDPNTTKADQTKVQAQLFLDINSKQKKVPAAIRQVINRMCDPLSDEGIAGDLMQNLIKSNIFKCDKTRISPSSIVSYSIIPLIKQANSRSSSLISQWKALQKITGQLTDQNRADYKGFLNEAVMKYFKGWVTMVESAGELTTNLSKSKALTGVGLGGVFYSMKYLIEEAPNGLVDRIQKWGENAFENVKFSYDPGIFKFSSNGRIEHGARLKEAVSKERGI